MELSKIHSYLVEDYVTVNIYILFSDDFMGKVVEISAPGFHNYKFFNRAASHLYFGTYNSHTTYPLTRGEIVQEFFSALNNQ